MNNLSESFNFIILEARDKPIIAMLEWIRVRLMTRMYNKRSGIEKFTSDICPNIVQKLEQLKLDSNEYERHVSKHLLFHQVALYMRLIMSMRGMWLTLQESVVLVEFWI